MHSEEVLKENEELEQKWQKDCLQRYKGKEFELTTRSGISVKTVYTPQDIKDIDYKDIGMPGEYPFTRGIYPLMYQSQAWQNRFVSGYGLPERCRERYDYLTSLGNMGYQGWESHCIAQDLPTRLGYDPDHPLAKGRVGVCGVSLCTTEDMERLCHDYPLDQTYLNFIELTDSLPKLALYVAYAEKRGYSPAQLVGDMPNSSYCTLYQGMAGHPPETSMILMVEYIKYTIKHMPRWNNFVLEAYEMAESGATAIQEIAFPISAGIAVAEKCIQAGLDPDDFMPHWTAHSSFGNDFFEDIAKTRAFRRIWARIAQERFGCKNPKSMMVRNGAQTAGSMLMAQEPLNNVIRATIHTIAAVLAGVNGLSTDSYDEPICIPSDEAVKLALRTQQIIQHETRIPNVTDPLAGSYYMEWLTNELDEKATKLIEEIEQKGFVNCWKSGWFRKELEKSANEWRARVDGGEEVVVGLNKYASEEKQEVEFFVDDPDMERIAVERVREFKQKRDNAKTKQALDECREVARQIAEGAWESDMMLMPSLINAARADATLGEITDALREVFGWGYTF